MAKASASLLTVVTLELTEKEAEVLVDILNCVGGNTDTTRCKHVNDICGALEAVGIESIDGVASDLKGSLTFS